MLMSIVRCSIESDEVVSHYYNSNNSNDDDDDDDEGRINFSVALSPKTTRTRNNKPKQ